MSRDAPDRSKRLSLLGQRILRLWLLYLRGQLLCALGIGAITWIVGSGIGLAGALWLGVFAGLMETIPHVGPLIAVVPAIIVALWQGSSVLPVSNWIFALIVAAVYLAIQQIGSLVLQPRVIGKELDLPPLAVLLAVVAGAALGGIVGLYLAVPLLVTIRELVGYALKRGANGVDHGGSAVDVASAREQE